MACYCYAIVVSPSVEHVQQFISPSKKRPQNRDAIPLLYILPFLLGEQCPFVNNDYLYPAINKIQSIPSNYVFAN